MTAKPVTAFLRENDLYRCGILWVSGLLYTHNIHTYIYLHGYIYIYIYVYIYIYTYLYIHIYVNIYISIYTYICIYLRVCVCIHTSTDMYMYTYIYIHHIHTYLHMCISGFSELLQFLDESSQAHVHMFVFVDVGFCPSCVVCYVYGVECFAWNSVVWVVCIGCDIYWMWVVYVQSWLCELNVIRLCWLRCYMCCLSWMWCWLSWM